MADSFNSTGTLSTKVAVLNLNIVNNIHVTVKAVVCSDP